LALAEKVARNAPLAVAASKRIMAHRRDLGSDWSAEVWQRNTTEFDDVFASLDAREGRPRSSRSVHHDGKGVEVMRSFAAHDREESPNQ
jgi:hypothetical protein